MPRAALHPDEIAAFRRRATDAAMHLFAAHGYDGVTMRGLADALGVSAMTPYRYVDGKEALFMLVRTAAFRRFAEKLEAALVGRGDALDRIVRLKKAYLGFGVAEPDAYRIMFELRKPDLAEPAELQAEIRRAFAPIRRSVAEAVDAGLLAGDALTIAHLAWADAHGLVSLHLAGRLGAARSLRQLAAVDHELAAFRTRKPRRKR